MNKIVAVVGMAGSGKSTVSDMLVKKGFGYLRFGQITIDEIKNRGLELNEQNERMVRHELRQQYGMAAYAKLNILKLEELQTEGNVVADGLYSWEEYLELKNSFKEQLITLAVYSSPKTRYERLEARSHDPKKDKDARFRPTTVDESKSRDKHEIEELNKGGPIAMADYTIINESSTEDLEQEIELFLERMELK